MKEEYARSYPSSTRWRTLIDLFPMSGVGVLVSALSFYLLDLYGEQEQDYLLYISMKAILALFGLLIVLLAFEVWRVKRWTNTLPPLPPHEVEVGQALLTGFHLPDFSKSLLFNLKIKWVSPLPEAYELIWDQGQLAELTTCARRGYITSITREVIIEDLFGFSSIRWCWKQQASLSILPRSSSLNSLILKQVQDGEDLYDASGRPEGDLVELRRYQDGDSLKLIVWRLYARSRQLMVRRPERAFSLKQDLVAYFVVDPTDESAASTARAYIEQGLLGDDFMFFADGCIGAATNISTSLAHLLSSADGIAGQGLEQILELEVQRQRGCVIFASAATPIELLSSISYSLPSPPTFILSYPSEFPTPPMSRLSRLFLQLESTSNLDHFSDPVQLHSTYLQLRSEGCSPLLIAQPEGRLISELELSRMAGLED